MTVVEAAEKWGISENTIKGRLKPARRTAEIDYMEDAGLIKSFMKKGGKRKEWIISDVAMNIWFGNK